MEILLYQKAVSFVAIFRIGVAGMGTFFAVINKIEAEVGPIDILINNVGIIKRTPIIEIEVADFEAVIKVDLTGPIIVSKNAAKGMIERGGGKIINMCSMMSELGRDSVSAYASAKC